MLADKRVHAVMPTHDVERLAAFYRDVLGIRVRAERPGAVIFETSPGLGLRRLADRGALERDAHADGLHGDRRRGRGRGPPHERRRAGVLRGADHRVNGVATVPAGRAAWFKDPDGNLVGLFQFDDPA